MTRAAGCRGETCGRRARSLSPTPKIAALLVRGKPHPLIRWDSPERKLRRCCAASIRLQVESLRANPVLMMTISKRLPCSGSAPLWHGWWPKRSFLLVCKLTSRSMVRNDFMLRISGVKIHDHHRAYG